MSHFNMIRPRIKICGLTCIEDALAAVEVGADAIGLVFYEPSSRSVSPDEAREMIQALPPFVTTVGLFVNPEATEVEACLNQVPLDLLQFHGNESNSFCEQFQRPWIKAVRMKDDVRLDQLNDLWPGARGFLLDAYRPGVPGGTGDTFDWTRIPHQRDYPLILAGGLTPDNVGAAVSQTNPFAVDVSGGVESSPGRKSTVTMRAFIKAVYKASRCNDWSGYGSDS
ncbi:phosphoribosylanthranilate isomerase [Terasakiispira papahanaumokuakeensis]|nr:phosphoribosylanthranilate isomerase [Terasakiispira papahanaumokuakeensis]